MEGNSFKAKGSALGSSGSMLWEVFFADSTLCGTSFVLRAEMHSGPICRGLRGITYSCSEAFLFLLSARACGLGIDLPSITSVIVLDSDWDPRADVQALGRAHTLGSLGSPNTALRVLRLFMRNSVEERILMLAERRGGIGAAFRPGSAGG